MSPDKKKKKNLRWFIILTVLNFKCLNWFFLSCSLWFFFLLLQWIWVSIRTCLSCLLFNVWFLTIFSISGILLILLWILFLCEFQIYSTNIIYMYIDVYEHIYIYIYIWMRKEKQNRKIKLSLSLLRIT